MTVHACITIFISRVLPSFLPVRPWYSVSKNVFEHQTLTTIDSIDVLFQYRAVPLPLHICQTNVYIDLFLYARPLLDITIVIKETTYWVKDFSRHQLSRVSTGMVEESCEALRLLSYWLRRPRHHLNRPYEENYPDPHSLRKFLDK